MFLSACTGEDSAGVEGGEESISGSAYFIGAGDHSNITISLEHNDTPGVAAAQTTTDATGTYLLSALASGDYTVYASSPDSSEKVVSTSITIVSGNALTVTDLFLTPVGLVSGSAVLGGEVDHRGITVFLEGTSFGAHTDAAGAYQISDVPVGTYAISATYQGFQTTLGGSAVVTQGTDLVMGGMTLLPINQAPVAIGFNLVTLEDLSVNFTLTGNDVDGDSLTYAVVSSPSNGVLSGTPPVLNYTPFLDYSGFDSFTYKVNDGTVDSNVGTVSITVMTINFPPIAFAGQDWSVGVGARVTLDGGASIDPEGNALTYSWTQSSGVIVELSDATVAKPTFTAPSVAGDLIFALTVNDGASDSAPDTVTIAVASGSQVLAGAEVDGGYDHTLALKADGNLWAFGQGGSGALGTGTTASANSPVQVCEDYTASCDTFFTGVKVVSAGFTHSLAIKEDGTLWAWGYNGQGQLGLDDLATRLLPVMVNADTNWAAISAGESFSLALKTTGTLWAWGDNSWSQLGTGFVGGSYLVPTRIGPELDWKAIAAGLVSSFALKDDGSLWAWGYNDSGVLGGAALLDTNAVFPSPVGTDKDWLSLSSGRYHGLALKTDGSVWTWGYDTSGQLGDGVDDIVGLGAIRNFPDRVCEVYDVGGGTCTTYLTGVLNIAAGNFHNLVRKGDNTLWGWGYNARGQVGDGTIGSGGDPLDANRFTAVQEVFGASDWVYVATGADHSFGIKGNGLIWGWGYGDGGELGNGGTTNPTPAPVFDTEIP